MLVSLHTGMHSSKIFDAQILVWGFVSILNSGRIIWTSSSLLIQLGVHIMTEAVTIMSCIIFRGLVSDPQVRWVLSLTCYWYLVLKFKVMFISPPAPSSVSLPVHSPASLTCPLNCPLHSGTPPLWFFMPETRSVFFLSWKLKYALKIYFAVFNLAYLGYFTVVWMFVSP